MLLLLSSKKKKRERERMKSRLLKKKRKEKEIGPEFVDGLHIFQPAVTRITALLKATLD